MEVSYHYSPAASDFLLSEESSVTEWSVSAPGAGAGRYAALHKRAEREDHAPGAAEPLAASIDTGSVLYLKMS